MFSDPFTAIMALILLAFIGTLAVFFRIWREIDGLRQSLNNIRDNLRLYAVDTAQQNRELAALVRELCGDSLSHAEKNESNLGDLLETGIPNLTDIPASGVSVVEYAGHSETNDIFSRLAETEKGLSGK